MSPDWKLRYLYGGDNPWDSSLWIASDDRVRGGKSRSHLRCKSPEEARFFGHLDITTLGGAGFASQRTLPILHLDLSQYDGLSIKVLHGDAKKYTITLKSDILPPSDDGREQSTVSWEYDFVPEPGLLNIPWSALNPTYRGRPYPDAEPLDLSDVKRISLMMRSFFGTQEGDFSLSIAYLAAFSNRPTTSDSNLSFEKPGPAAQPPAQPPATPSSWWACICPWAT